MLEEKYKRQQLALLINQCLIILFLLYEYIYGNEIKNAETMQMLIIMVIVYETIYIGKMNVKCNSMMKQFQALLILITWYFLLSLDSSRYIEGMFPLMIAITFYFMLCFILLFFFQGTSYKYKKLTDIVLLVNCVINLAAKFIGNRLFNLLLLYQISAGILVCCGLFIVHYKRLLFVIKSGWSNLRFSLLVCISVFAIYICVFGREKEYIDNFGAYLLIFIALVVVHCIMFNQGEKRRNILILSGKNKVILTAAIGGAGMTMAVVLAQSMVSLFILIHCIFLCYLAVHFIIVTSGEGGLIYSQELLERYQISIKQVKKEEALKKEFSDFLHDNVLQDILAINNLIKKADDEGTRLVISQTLEQLNYMIRAEMNNYHPQLLNSLTLKENFDNLIRLLLEKFSADDVLIDFECDDTFFLVEPYNIILYRIIKELLTNALKHSCCSHIYLGLIQKKEMVKLVIKDNGLGFDREKSIGNGHSGITSIEEQLAFLNGHMEIISEERRGTTIYIHFIMRGEESYAYFINR